MVSVARIIPNFPGYMVDDSGNVWSFKKKQPYILAFGLSEKGYAQIGLSVLNKRTGFRVHRLIASVFLKDWDPTLTVNHKDGNKLNNCVSNLEMCSHRENINHAIKMNLFKGRPGETNNAAKLTNLEVKLIRCLLNKYSGVKLAKVFNVSPTVISYIKNNKTYKDL